MSVVERPDGARIWWTAEGSGEPLVLVMGLGYPSDMWHRLLPALAGRYRVIRLDNRGAGRTGDVPGAPYTVETMAGDLLAVMDAAGELSAHVFGVSMGGLIAQEAALTAPDRVRSLILGCTHPGVAHAVLSPDALAMLASRAQLSPEQAANQSLPFNYAPSTPRRRIEEDWAVRMPLASSSAGYSAQLRGTATWSGLERLPTLRVPTLVLHGEQDRLVPVANGRSIAEEVPGAELVVIPGANHLFFTDAPEETVSVLLDWLSRHSRSDGGGTTGPPTDELGTHR
jgi:3-oxoadipate enol-lactonase